MTIFPSTEEQISPRRSHREFQSMLEGVEEELEVCVEEAGHPYGKKRRLSLDQVKALEKNFEVENKLEPERKVKLAQEIGLQPRQVAVWFQNRRARWKTKQLERDYGVLKANYDALKLSYDNLNEDNQALRKQMKELKWRVVEEKRKSEAYCVVGAASWLKEKEGYSESDSSGILNEEDKCSPKWEETLNFSISTWPENNFLTADEACNFFSDEQPPTLHSGLPQNGHRCY